MLVLQTLSAVTALHQQVALSDMKTNKNIHQAKCSVVKFTIRLNCRETGNFCVSSVSAKRASEQNAPVWVLVVI